MPAAFELGLQPDLDHAVEQFAAQQIRGQAQDVGVVVAAAHLRRDAVVARGGAHAGHLIGGDAHADAGAVDEDAAVHASFAHGLADGEGVVGVIDAVAALRSQVEDLMSQALQQGDDAAFDFEAAVVAADGDSHDAPGSSLIARFAQKKVSGTFRRSRLQYLLRLESSRHLFLGWRPSRFWWRQTLPSCSENSDALLSGFAGKERRRSQTSRSRTALFCFTAPRDWKKMKS